MTIRDLFRAVIRLFGLYTLFSIITVISSVFPYWSMLNFLSLNVIIPSIIGIIITVGLFVLVIGYPDTIINMFRLMKGFGDDRVICNKESIFKLIGVFLFVTGGYLIVDNAVPLLFNIFKQFSDKDYFSLLRSNDYAPIIKQVLFVTIGCFIITNYGQITQFFFKNNNLKNDSTPEN